MKKILHVRTKREDTTRHIETLMMQNKYFDQRKGVLIAFDIATKDKPIEADYIICENRPDGVATICQIDLMNSHDKSSFISIYNIDPAEEESTAMFYDRVLQHFAALELIVPPKKPEPWKKSQKEKQSRDKIIWDARQSGETWEKTAELANNCGVTTAKEAYTRMQEIVESGNPSDSD